MGACLVLQCLPPGAPFAVGVVVKRRPPAAISSCDQHFKSSSKTTIYPNVATAYDAAHRPLFTGDVS